MTITSAKVVPGCISCRNCENICPEIFKVDPTSHIISDKFNQNAIKLLMAEKMCPVNVIKVEKQGSYNLENPEASLISKKYLTPDTIELVFKTKDFKFIPGQFVSLQMSDMRGEFSRSYSIASGTSNSFTLTVKLLDKWRGSSYLRKLWERSWKTAFRKQSKVEYIWALGDFVLQDTPARKVMIATGTGLAPMISMLEALPDEIEKIVVFGGRYEEDLYYIDTLKSFKNTQLRLCVSRPSDTYSGNVGRVTDYIHDLTSDDEVYICGNPDMVSQVAATLKSDGHTSDNIYHEDFTLASKPTPLWKSILLDWNIPWIASFQNICIYVWAIGIPIFYAIATYNLWLWKTIAGVDIYTLLFQLSWYSVVFVMLIRPLADIFPKIWAFRRAVVLRKWLGILSASIIVSILLAKWIQNPFTFTAFFTASAWTLWMWLFARLSEITAIVLLITSNTFSQKILWIWWKRIQKISYIYFVTGWILAAQWSSHPYSYYLTIWFVALVWFLAQIWVKFWKIRENTNQQT